MPSAETAGRARARLHGFLHDDSLDGRRWLLVVDEAHRAHRGCLGRDQGPGKSIGSTRWIRARSFLAPTPTLLRTLATREFRGICPNLASTSSPSTTRSRRGTRALRHGRATTAAGTTKPSKSGIAMLAAIPASCSGSREFVWRVCRPRRAIGSNGARQVADRLPPQLSPRRAYTNEQAELELAQNNEASVAQDTSAELANRRVDTSAVVPARPPLRVEEGLVEVGWDGDLESEPATDYAANHSDGVAARRFLVQRRDDRGSVRGAPGLERVDTNSGKCERSRYCGRGLLHRERPSRRRRSPGSISGDVAVVVARCVAGQFDAERPSRAATRVCAVQPALHAVASIKPALITGHSESRYGDQRSMRPSESAGAPRIAPASSRGSTSEKRSGSIDERRHGTPKALHNGLSSAMFDVRGSLTISLTSRCRRRRSWCSRPFLFPGGTATTVDLARTTLSRIETGLP